jgi:hypothetical protein
MESNFAKHSTTKASPTKIISTQVGGKLTIWYLDFASAENVGHYYADKRAAWDEKN